MTPNYKTKYKVIAQWTSMKQQHKCFPDNERQFGNMPKYTAAECFEKKMPPVTLCTNYNIYLDNMFSKLFSKIYNIDGFDLSKLI